MIRKELGGVMKAPSKHLTLSKCKIGYNKVSVPRNVLVVQLVYSSRNIILYYNRFLVEFRYIMATEIDYINRLFIDYVYD